MSNLKDAFYQWLTETELSEENCTRICNTIDDICREIAKDDLLIVHSIVEYRYVNLNYALSKYNFFKNIRNNTHIFDDNDDEFNGISWEELATDLPLIILGYVGRKKTALQKYNEFLFETELPNDILNSRNQNILCIMDQTQIQCQEQDYILTSDLAERLKINVRVIKRWRAERIKQGNSDPSKFEQLKENPHGKGKIGPRFVIVGGIYRYYLDDLRAYFGRDISEL